MSLRDRWTLDPSLTFLNHGSFGACPRAVLEAQAAMREELERAPSRFFFERMQEAIDEARRDVAAFVGARPEDLAFVRNASVGINAVLRSLRLDAGDQLLTTDHVYHACENTLRFVADRAGAEVVIAPVPFPVASEDEVVEAVLSAVTERTRLALIDHVTSPTGLVLPVARVVEALAARGVDTLVDGAHAPGMLDLDVTAIGAAYYVANFHKHTCAPKGAGMLHVRADRQEGLHPAVISHGFDAPVRERSRFHLEMDWTGTDDITPWLCVPVALREVGAMLEGGWPAVRARNRALALSGRATLCDALGVEPPAPASMIGTLAAVPLPNGPGATDGVMNVDPLQRALLHDHGVDVMIPKWPAAPKRLVRITAHLYVEEADVRRLIDALAEELAT